MSDDDIAIRAVKLKRPGRPGIGVLGGPRLALFDAVYGIEVRLSPAKARELAFGLLAAAEAQERAEDAAAEQAGEELARIVGSPGHA